MSKKYLSRKDIVGKQVIDSQAKILGNVTELSFDLETRDMGLTITTKKGKEINVSSGDMSSIGEVILLKRSLGEIEIQKVIKKAPSPPPTPPLQPAKQGLCAVCGFQNGKSAKFCTKCGTKIR